MPPIVPDSGGRVKFLGVPTRGNRDRVIHSSVLSIREMTYVEVARAPGVSH